MSGHEGQLKMQDDRLIFEKGSPGRRGYSLPAPDIDIEKYTDGFITDEYRRNDMPDLPEVSEPEVIRHFTGLSLKNFGVDNGFYPLGSCTMKYNPKINEDMAMLEGFSEAHPCTPDAAVQGCLEMLWHMENLLAEILGFKRVTLQPAAGAHGELTAMMIMKAYHLANGDVSRKKILVPDSSHGTNPASAVHCGFEVIELHSDERGLVDITALENAVGDGGDSELAGLMLTNPNTLGLFEKDIIKIAEIVHNAGGLLYYDGANMNAILGKVRPGDMGFDMAHINLHKTFSTPHGGGGPGAGPVGVCEKLIPFLPIPVIEKRGAMYTADCDRPISIGRVGANFGNFGVILKAYTYILSMGAEGLEKISEAAVLNANYLKSKLEKYYCVPYKGICMHEFVLSAVKQAQNGISATDIAKNLIDRGCHPPTVYFPLIVKEAMMIEPTESESRETLDRFAEIMAEVATIAEKNPELLKGAPHTAPVKRLDEVTAARNPVLRYKCD